MHLGRFFGLDELLESVERVTAGGVKRIACNFFDPRQIALTVLGSLDGLRIHREDLDC
jgi:hypothetical protein